MLPTISVIIPCYNSGNYLMEAIESVKKSSHKYSYEIVITNDGSTDKQTLLLLKELSQQGYLVLHQENRGPASARNTAINNSKGEYLLFLDADNKIKDSYIDKAVDILNSNEAIGVVYANPTYFGNIIKERVFVTRTFNIRDLIAENYIDMCSIVRKKVWESISGFDEKRVLIGHEDWDFWIRTSKLGWKFFYLNEELFYYRINNNSLISTIINNKKYQDVFKYIYEKHHDLVFKYYRELNEESKQYKNDKNRPLHSLFKFSIKKYLNKKNV